MGESFDDLYNDFFNKGEEKKKKKDGPLSFIEEFFNFLEKQSIPITIDSIKSTEIKDYEKELGKPDKIEIFEEKGFTFEKKYWKTEKGTVVCVEMITNKKNTKKKNKDNELSDEILEGFRKDVLDLKIKDLKNNLKLAIEEEDYLGAAKLRDKISELENTGKEPVKRKRRKKE